MAAPWLKRHEVKLLVVCMSLLALAAGWLFSTRPGHRIEGDFFEREQAREADEWLFEQSRANPIAEHRARACLALARIGGNAARERLIEALSDAAPSVRAMAAFGLGVIEDEVWRGGPGGAHAAEALIAALGDSDRRVQARAVDSLGRMRWGAAAEAIVASPAPLVSTLLALAGMREDGWIEWIVEQLDSDDQDIRWASSLAAAELGVPLGPRLTPRLVLLSRDQNNFVRAAAARALALAEPPARIEVLEALTELAADRDPKVRFEAGRALLAQQQNEDGGLFEALRGDSNPHVRSLAEAALAGEAPLFPPSLPAPTRPPAVEPRGRFEPRRLQEIARRTGRRLLIETDAGECELALDYEHAPLAAERFYELAREGRFDGQTFAAVAPNGYVQAAASVAAGGRPEVHAEPFLRGSLGMVRTSPDADAAEFFVAVTPLPFAAGRYTNFGRLVSGDALLDRITTETKILRIRPVH